MPLAKRDRYVYFLYSDQQYADRLTIEKTRGKVYVPGKVLTKSGYKQYTEISENATNNYGDCSIVDKGYLSTFKYTD